jgi:hypothetical protein
MTERDALKKLAQAQGALFRLTKQLLKTDKTDGLRMARLTMKHEEVYEHISEELRSYGFVSEEEVAAANKIAGYSE